MGKCGNDAPIVIEGKKGDPGERGLPGEKGESITQVGSSITAEGDTQVNLSDGSSFIVKKGIDGTNGLNGMDGKSITFVRSETDSLGNTIVYLSDGSSFPVSKGDKGDRGANGDRGQDGTSITIRSTSIADNGDVELHFSDGTVVPIPKGERGANGRDGVDGHDKVQVSDTEPTDPNISLWIKPDGENCCTVTCEDLNNTLSDYYRKDEAVSLQNLKDLAIYNLNQTENSADYDYHHSGNTTVPDFRRGMTYSKVTRLGIIHLDFEKIDGGGSTNKDVVFRLPDDAPTPINYIEFKDGANRVFMGPHERIVYMQGNLKERTLVNLIGYFDY